MKLYLPVFILGAAPQTSDAFVPTRTTKNKLHLHAAADLRSSLPALFEDDEEMIPVAEAYIHAKYKQVTSSHGHKVATKDDVRGVLHSILPPVTLEELQKEEESIITDILSHKQNTPDAIDEDDFVKSIFNNSYWKEAGDIVVKELSEYCVRTHIFFTYISNLCYNSYIVQCILIVCIAITRQVSHC